MEKIPVFLPNLGTDELESIKKVFDIGWLGMGSTTKDFEDSISNFLELDDRFVLSTNTATSALHLSLRCCDIGPGDEVITPSFNCVADHQAIRQAGADVVMCDIVEDNLGIDVSKAESLISEKTKAIIPLHYSGIPCNQKGVYELAKKYDLRVIEDCCHAFGTQINQKKLGSYGDLAVFSFDPIKTITSVDGGCLIVNSEEELSKLQHMRLLGMDNDTFERYKNKRLWKNYDVNVEGYRYHLNNVLASIGISQLQKIEKIITSRQDTCNQFNEAFRTIDDIIIPNSDYKDISAFCYVLRIKNGKRESLIEYLKTKNIDTGIHWTPAHQFSYFSNVKHDDLKITNEVADEIVTIPLHSFMKQEFIDRIIKGIIEYFQN